MTELTQEYLKEILHYDPNTGVWSWNVRRGKVRAGDVAGTDHGEGYRSIMIDYKRYLAHRLAFVYMIGRFPADQADHINQDKSDDRWFNLREVDNQTNLRNQRIRKINTSGIMGVSWHKRDKIWQARIVVDGVILHLGGFKDKAEAAKARAAADIKYGFHPNHGSQ